MPLLLESQLKTHWSWEKTAKLPSFCKEKPRISGILTTTGGEREWSARRLQYLDQGPWSLIKTEGQSQQQRICTILLFSTNQASKFQITNNSGILLSEKRTCREAFSEALNKERTWSREWDSYWETSSYPKHKVITEKLEVCDAESNRGDSNPKPSSTLE